MNCPQCDYDICDCIKEEYYDGVEEWKCRKCGCVFTIETVMKIVKKGKKVKR